VWSIPVDPDEKLKEIEVRGPAGKLRAPVANGRARLYGARAGIYHIGAGGGLALAANLADPVESKIQPAGKLVLAGKEIAAPPAFAPTLSRSIWVYLALGA